MMRHDYIVSQHSQSESETASQWDAAWRTSLDVRRAFVVRVRWRLCVCVPLRAPLRRPRQNSCLPQSLVVFAPCVHCKGPHNRAMRARHLGREILRWSVLFRHGLRLKIPSFGLRAPPVRRRRSWEVFESYACHTPRDVIVLDA